ncbi:MAG TPA: ABC transporter permease [Puia sp.]|jgi:putative ABC transport system permease protein
MLKNYLTIAWRNLRKNPVFSAINISGLAIGLAVCMLMLEYVGHEHSYDRFHTHAERIYSVQSKVVLNNDSFFTPSVKYHSGPMVMSRVLGVEGFTRLKKQRETVIVQNGGSPDLKFAENNVAFADPNFFRFFSFELLRGNPDEVLRRPYTVVISQKMAKKYFGSVDPVGRTLRYNNSDNFVVSGVVRDAPSNSSISYDFLGSMTSLVTFNKGEELKSNESATWFLLKQPADARRVEAALAQLAQAEQGPVKVDIRYIATPLTETHLAANFGDTSNTKYLGVFPFVAAMILLLAVINYSSLSTAGATARAKEIGVRKTLGAARKTIALQFFAESALLTAVAFIIGYGLCAACQPAFFRFLNIDIDSGFLYSPYLLMSFGGLFLVSVLLAAIYPALVLSAFSPLQVLYGRLTGQTRGLSMRKLFTAFQFTIAVTLIICGLVMRRQMDFFRHSDTGVRRSNIVMIPFSKEVGMHYPAFKKEIATLPAVRDVSTCSYPLYKEYDIAVVPGQGGKGFIPLPHLFVDANFIPMLGLRWKIPPPDSAYTRQPAYAVFNEAAVEKLALKGNPLNQVVNGQFTVKGVLRDFNYSSLQNKIDAMVLSFNQDGDTASGWAKQGGCIFVRISAGVNVPTVMDRLRAIHTRYDAASPFTYHFMDEVFDGLYSAEDKLSRIFSAFTLFTLIIACLGLFGMSLFTISRRMREITIRKVLGAGVAGLAGRLSVDFLKPVLLAVVIASPLGWYGMHRWLQGFAYRVEMRWWVLLLAGAVTALIALLTVGLLVYRAASASPARNLRTE